ncbi:MAG: response regulator, partial [Bdellovibrionales bacterium]|nr:response regulator [Bdellovibrionales bacterium]
MNGHILILDDNPIDIKVVASVLEREGFAAFGFTDHRSALGWAQGNTPQAIFLDLQMPTITGFQVLPLLRAFSHLEQVPIIIISGKNQTEDVKQAIRLGATDYIIKPIDPLLVTEKLRKISREIDSEFHCVELSGPGGKQAFASKQIRILSFSEFGMHIQASHPVAIGETFDVTGAPGEIFGGAPILVRCLSSRQIEKTDEHSIQVTF